MVRGRRRTGPWQGAVARWWPAAAGAVLLGARVAHLYNPYFVVDDAFISFRYAANLAHGLGLVYNPGERVEGYSNFLWTVFIAGGLRLGLEPVRLSIALSLAAGLASVVLLAFWARRLFAPLMVAQAPAAGEAGAAPGSGDAGAAAGSGDAGAEAVSGDASLAVGSGDAGAAAGSGASAAAGSGASAAASPGDAGASASAAAPLLCALPPLLFAATGSQARYVVSGMETLLFGFLVLAAVYLLAVRDRPRAAGALFALAAATRPEGGLYWMLAVCLTLWPGTEPAGATPRPRLRRAVELAAVFLLLFLPYFFWRWSYYGYPLPNTYYAKAGGFTWSRVARGATLFVEVCGWWSVYPLALAALAALPAVRRCRMLALCLAFVAATIAYFLYVGGDFLPFFGPRFLMPVLPMLLLLATAGVRTLGDAAATVSGRLWRTLPPAGAPGWHGERRRGPGGPGAQRVRLAVVLAAGALLLANALWRSWPAGISNLGMIAAESEAWEKLGRWIAASTPRQAVLATGTAGIVPYYCRRFTIDMFGLADEHIAHRQPLVVGFKQVAHERYDPQYVLDRKPDLLISYCDRRGVPRQAGLPRQARRVRACYRPLLLIKDDGSSPRDGRWLIPSRVFSPELYDAGYRTVLFERRCP